MLRLDQGMKIKNKYESFKLDTTDKMLFYVDFEYINGSDLSFEKDTRVHLYMIGLGYEENGEWVYREFIPESLNDREEKRNVINWMKFMKDKSRNYVGYQIIHWTHAEPSLFERLKINLRIRGNLEWRDLQKVFKDNRIVYEGMTDFSLKTVGRVMRGLGYIESGWDDGIMDGLGANLALIEGLKIGDLRDIDEMEEIVKYNEIDCRVLYEILRYLSSEVKKNM